MNAKKKHSRRRFLVRSAGFVAAGTLASTCIPAVHAAGSDRLKIALVGCGNRGTGAVAQALNTEGPVVLWAMADLFSERIENCLHSLQTGLAKNYDRDPTDPLTNRIDVPPERRFVGFEAYRHAIDSDVDVVLLTTFPHFRPEHYEYAVEKGKHVFMEKPVAVDAPGIRRLLKANETAKRKRLKVGVGLQRHHHGLYQETIARVHDGAIGDPVYLRCYWNGPTGSALGPREPGMTEMEYQARNRYFFTWLCGDHIVEQHVHNIDVCNWIMQDHPVEAQGMGGRQWRNGREHGEIFDHHAVEFTYADGTKMFSYCRQTPNCWNSIAEFVTGTKGAAQLGQAACRIEAGGNKWEARWVKKNPYQVEHDVLFQAVREDLDHNEAEYGALSTMTAIMGRMATYSGQRILWDDAIASETALVPDRYAWDGTPPVLPDANGAYPSAVPGVTKPY
ncbi:Gfo/Idh/MocA family oxidoreductase [Thermostilla marina]